MATAYATMKNTLDESPTNQKWIDLRSDTVTRPSAGMYEAMMSAPLGDDVYGDDQSVNTLEAMAAELLGKEAALFSASGTQSNLVAMLTHCGRGEEVITGDNYHVYINEAAGASVLGGIAICPLATDEHGGLSPDQVKAAVKEDDPHHPVSRLLSLENTVAGYVQPIAKIEALVETARAAGLSTHLDGARLMNAAVALDVAPATLAAPFDSVSLCLSKGLGAPVGTILCASRQFIDRARRHRKLLGGGMRQAGILAACGSYALTHNIKRLAEDHANAKLLAQGLSSIPGSKVQHHTNMVFIELPSDNAAALQTALRQQGILISAGYPSIRLVTHLDVDQSQIERVIDAIRQFFD